MRITNSMYYRDMYGENNKMAQALFDVNKQISSTQKIQYAYEDTPTFINAMRLDNEMTTLTQVKKSTESAYKFSTQTDTVLGEFTKTLDTMKTKLIQAASSTQSPNSMQAIANDLRGLEGHLKSLANTSINGKFLFSGSQTTTKPIDANGEYQGNNKVLDAFLGHEIRQQYNISGSDLFLGEESTVNRKISTNVRQLDMNALYPDVMQASTLERVNGEESYITSQSTIRELMGDTDTDTTNDPQTYFYVRGTGHDGTTFKSKISMNSADTVDDLMAQIENDYLTKTNTSVNVSINEYGQIEIEDKNDGSSKLDFHMVAAIDFDQSDLVDDADVTDIDLLNGAETDFKVVADDPATAALFVKEFTKSGMNSSVGTTIDGLMYDRTAFEKDGVYLKSNVPQIVSADNSYATDSTLLSDVFSDLSSSLHVSGQRLDGTAFNIDIAFGSPAAVSGDYAYNVGDGQGNDTDGSAMTYRQLMDVINMAMNNVTPADNDAGYRSAIESANANSHVTLDAKGAIALEDFTAGTSTQAALSIYDNNSNDFSLNASMVSFNANSALTISDPKTNFFAQLNEAISAVEQMRYRADGDAADPRNGGIQNAIQIIDNLNQHTSRMQTKAGSQSQALSAATTRSDMLILNTKVLKSEVLDTDIAEATLKLQQLQLNYQAMYSSIAKISNLSLVNYI